MRKTIKNTQIGELCTKRTAVSILLVSLVLFSGVAIGQSQISQTDDFEDQSVAGWDGTSTYPQISTDSVEGNYSMLSATETGAGLVSWKDGPFLDLQEGFTISGTFKGTHSNVGDGQSIRLGISSGNPDAEGENIYLAFDDYNGETYLSTYRTQPPAQDSIQQSFANTWVNFEIQSEDDNNTVTAKVWEYGTTEPSSFQVSREFEGQSGEFTVDTGGAEPATREAFLDSVTISGTEATDPSLILDTEPYMDYGTSQDYAVIQLVGDADSYSAIRTDVTAEANLSSTNSNVIQVDENTNTLTATNDTSVNERVPIRVEYNGSVTYTNVTVASTTVDNVKILPGWRKVSAVFLDKLFQVLIGGTLIAIAATRVSGAFAGISTLQLSMTIGWLIGWVPIGMALVSLFASLFIGLNLAANIDYTVRR